MTVIFCYRYENKHASQTPDTICSLTTVARNYPYESCHALQSLGFSRGGGLMTVIPNYRYENCHALQSLGSSWGPHDGRPEQPS